jgi:CRISPR-associated protein Csd2
MGRKHIVPYGLYRAHIFVSAKLAERTGFSQEDLEHVFDALKTMFEHDRSAARGEMGSRRVVAFKHSSVLGNAPAYELFDRVTVQRRFRGDLYPLDDDRLDNAPPARRYEDYEISLQRDGLPQGIEIVNVL